MDEELFDELKEQGLYFTNIEDFEKAEAIYENILTYDPKNNFSLMHMGMLKESQRDSSSAIEYYLKIMDNIKNEDDEKYQYHYKGRISFLLGVSYMSLAEKAEIEDKTNDLKAIEYFEYVANNDYPILISDALFFNLGLAHQYLEHYEDAIKYFNIVLFREPRRDDVYRLLGMIYTNLKMKDEAIQANLKTLDIYYGCENLFSLGITYDNFGMHEEAIESLEKAIEMEPTFQEAIIELARVKDLKSQPTNTIDQL